MTEKKDCLKLSTERAKKYFFLFFFPGLYHFGCVFFLNRCICLWLDHMNCNELLSQYYRSAVSQLNVKRW